MQRANNPLNSSGNSNNNTQQPPNSIPLPRYPPSSNNPLNMQNVNQLNNMVNNPQRGNPMMQQNRNMMPTLSASNPSLSQPQINPSNFAIPSSGQGLHPNMRSGGNNPTGGGQMGGPINATLSTNTLNFLRNSSGTISPINPMLNLSSLSPNLNSSMPSMMGPMNPMISNLPNQGNIGNTNSGNRNLIGGFNSPNSSSLHPPPPSSSSSSGMSQIVYQGGHHINSAMIDTATSSSPPSVNFDVINDFPALGNPHRPPSDQSSGGSKGGVEYKLQSKEDFPALGAYSSNKQNPSTSSATMSATNATSSSNPSPLLPSPNPPSDQAQQGSMPALRAASGSIPNSPHDLSKLRNIGGGENKFDLMGLLGVIRMTDANLNTLALGTDLTTLGLNLNSPSPLYVNFTSPFADGNRKEMFDYSIPPCYKIPSQMQSLSTKINLFSEETLFYIFYSMPKDHAQLLAALELYRRDWKFHSELQRWFSRIPSSSPSSSDSNATPSSMSTSMSTSMSASMSANNSSANGSGNSFYVFEPKIWDKVRKDNFVVNFELFEEEKNIANFLQLYNNSVNSTNSGGS